MIDERDLFVRAAERFDAPTDAYQHFQEREGRRERRQRVGAAAIGLVVVLVLVGGFILAWKGAQRQKPISTSTPRVVIPSPTGDGWAAATLPTLNQPGATQSCRPAGPPSGGCEQPSRVRYVTGLAASTTGFVAVGSQGLNKTAANDGSCPIWFSSDGDSWSQVDRPACPGVSSLSGVIAGGPGFIAVGTTETYEPAIWYSEEGTLWQRASVSLPAVRMQDPDHVQGVIRTTSGFLAWGWVGNLDVYLWTSVDGKTWVPIRDESAFEGPGEPFVDNITQGPAGFIANGFVRPDGSLHTGAASVWTSPDGSSWTQGRPRGITRASWGWPLVSMASNYVSLAFGPRGLGHGTELWMSSDGISWTQGELPGDLSGAALASLRSDGHGGFVSLGTEHGEHTIWMSSDGSSWNALPGAPAADDTTLVAVGPRGVVVLPDQESEADEIWFHR